MQTIGTFYASHLRRMADYWEKYPALMIGLALGAAVAKGFIQAYKNEVNGR